MQQAGYFLCCVTLQCSEQGLVHPMARLFFPHSLSVGLTKALPTQACPIYCDTASLGSSDWGSQSSYNADAAEQGLHLRCHAVARCQLALVGPYGTAHSWAAAVQEGNEGSCTPAGGCGTYRCHTAVPAHAIKPGCIQPVPTWANMLYQTC